LISITNLAKELMALYSFSYFSSFFFFSLFFRIFRGDDHVVDLEKKFEPSLLNGGVYLISLSMHVSTFAINYQV